MKLTRQDRQRGSHRCPACPCRDLFKSAPDRNQKAQLVRDRFAMPKGKYAAIDRLKTRAIAMGTSVKKNELLRAGLMVLMQLNDAAHQRALASVPCLGKDHAPDDRPGPDIVPAARKRALSRKFTAFPAVPADTQVKPNAPRRRTNTRKEKPRKSSATAKG